MSVKWPVMAAAAAISGETRWVRPPRPWRPSKLRLAGGGAALAGLEDVGVHAEAHAAAGLAPLEAGGLEDLVEAFFFGLALDGLRAGDDHGADFGGDVVAFDDGGGGAEVFDAAVGAGAEEDGVDLDVFDLCAGLQAHVLVGAGEGFLVGFVVRVVESGDGGVDGGGHAGRGAPGDGGREGGGVDVEFAVEDGAFVGGEGATSGRRPRPMRRLAGRSGGP